MVAFLGILLTATGLSARDEPKEKPPPTPADQVKALEAEYKEAMDAYVKAMNAAKTPEERQQAARDKSPQTVKFAKRFLEIAEKNPRDPAAVDALVWVVIHTRLENDSPDKARARAVDQLKGHVTDARIAGALQALGASLDRASEELLRSVLEKNPDREVQAQACIALAQQSRTRASVARRWETNPPLLKGTETRLGKEYVETIQKAGPEGALKEAEKFYDLLAQKYPDAKQTVLAIQQLGYARDKASEALLHKFLDKGKPRAIQGQACFALAQYLKNQAEMAQQIKENTEDAKDYEAMLGKEGVEELRKADPEKLKKESVKLFERVVKEFADLPHPRKETIGKVAEGVLFKLHNLVAGKPAPEIEAEDVNGKPMKLSDYRGKVVLLDFWGNW
jgi:hypothetical protein